MNLSIPGLSAIEPADDAIEKEINERLTKFIAEDEDERRISSTDATISRAATIMRSFTARQRDFDYAFGKDGSIGIHSEEAARTEYFDILNDGRIRYFLRYDQIIKQGVLSITEAAYFVSRQNISSRSPVTAFSFGVSYQGRSVTIIGTERPALAATVS
jgi:hypothetical protein